MHALCLATARSQLGRRKPRHPKTWPTPLDAWVSPLRHHDNLRDAREKERDLDWLIATPRRNPEVSEFARPSSDTKDPTSLLK